MTMATPLTPSTHSNLNIQSLPPYEQLSLDDCAIASNLHSRTPTDEHEIVWEEEPSSPFVTEAYTDMALGNVDGSLARTTGADTFMARMQENLAPVQEEIEITPFTIAEDDTRTQALTQSSPKILNTPKRASSANRSPVKSARSIRSLKVEEEFTTASFATAATSKENAQAVENNFGDVTNMTLNDDMTIDDTCFSTFSEVPNADMTAFARLGQRSPTRQFMSDQQTPRPTLQRTPGTARTAQRASSSPRSPSPTPRQQRSTALPSGDGDTTNLLLDFTQQFETFSAQSGLGASTRSPMRRSPSKGSQLLSYIQSQRSPAKGGFAPSTPLGSKRTLLNLLDIELPPAPTPRSVPSITVRELESLKSELASEISSLKATLSGREAEVDALKRAVGDAERRVGESVEAAREEKSRREYVEKEKEEWERRGREFEEILKKVRKEVIEAEKERSETESRLADAEERVRDAETRAEEAEARAVEAATKLVPAADTTMNADDPQAGPLFTAEQVQKQIDEKVHALSTELHAIYKKKHVTKVAGLKKGFEAKTKEKTSELQSRIDDLERRNEDLQTKLDGTLSGVQVLPPSLDAAVREEDLKRLEEQSAVIERQKAELLGKDSELRTTRADFAILMKDLEQERVEKGELVAAVDEMLALQADASVLNAAASSEGVESLRKSIGLGSSVAGARPSGLARPGFGAPQTNASQSRIGQPGGLSRAGSAGKSRMMSNIERMGAGRVQ